MQTRTNDISRRRRRGGQRQEFIGRGGMTLLASLLPLLLIAGCSSMPPAGLAMLTPQEKRHIAFTTWEFTEPKIDVSSDGAELYFNVLGEIYRVPTEGGRASMLSLGGGWKERPMLSPDGKSIAFLSDLDGEVAVWRQPLKPGGIPFGRARTDSGVVTAAWVGSDVVVSSSAATTRHRPYSLSVQSFNEEGHYAEFPAATLGSGMFNASMSADDDGNIYFMRPGAGIVRVSRSSGLETVAVENRDGLSQPRVNHDGTLLGFVVLEKGQSQLFTKNVRSGAITSTGCMTENLRSEINGSGPEASYVFMPNNRSFLLARGGGIFRCDIGGKPKQIPISVDIRLTTAPMARPRRRATSFVSDQPRYLAAAPDLSQLAFTSQDHLWFVDVASRQAKRMSGNASREYMPAYSPSGTEITYTAIREDGRSEVVVRTISTGVEKVIASSKKLLLNAAWSPDGSKVAFVESVYGGRYETPHVLRWVGFDGRSGVFGEVEPGAFRYFPVLTWNSESTGIFYTKLEFLSLEVISAVIGKSPQTLLETDSTTWDARISPSGRYIAFQDKLGLSIAPFVASSAEHPHLSKNDLEGLQRLTPDGADYFQWLGDDHLVWSAQTEVYSARVGSAPAKIATLTVPKSQPARQVGRVAYVGARVLPMSAQGEIDDAVLITNNNKIEYVGPRTTDEQLAGLTVVDVSGKTIIPGIVDVHWHNLQTFEVEATAPVTQHMFSTVAYGVTTIFDPSSPTIDAGVKTEDSQSDDFLGPSFYSSGLPVLGAWNWSQTDVRSPEEASQLVHYLARAGVLLVKDYTQPNRSHRRWLADAARQWGLGITAHEANDLRTPLSLVLDGYTAFEHTMINRGIYDDVKTLLIDSEIGLTPTFGTVLGDADEYLRTITPSENQRASCLVPPRQWHLGHEPENAKNRLMSSDIFVVARDYADMLNRGANVSIGGHGSAPGLDSHWEMWLLQMAGATPMNILRAATVNGAKKLGMEDRIGSLAAGMDADFVVLNSNPLSDIRNTVDISRVVRRGRTVSWPSVAAPPGWSSDKPWRDCQAWNLGLPH